MYNLANDGMEKFVEGFDPERGHAYKVANT
jgi:hypothetical protein